MQSIIDIMGWALLSVTLVFLNAVTCSPEETCDPLSVSNGCTLNERCNYDTRKCECARGYTKKDKVCVPEQVNGHGNETPSSSSLTGDGGSGHIVAAVLVPIMIVSTLMIAAYVGQRFKVFSWLRNWLGRKTKYDEFMIGHEVEDDDDPPLH